MKFLFLLITLLVTTFVIGFCVGQWYTVSAFHVSSPANKEDSNSEVNTKEVVNAAYEIMNTAYYKQWKEGNFSKSLVMLDAKGRELLFEKNGNGMVSISPVDYKSFLK